MEMENIAGETNEHSLNIAIGESSATEEVVRG
jgi:hypothetical protein